MNIEGVVRHLPLFRPPIRIPRCWCAPEQQASILTSVLSDLLNSPACLSANYLLQKAAELCNELKSLGGALLSALEREAPSSSRTCEARRETAISFIAQEPSKSW